MPEIKKILSPVDFSETSEAALRYAIDLASRLGAKIEVVHAFSPPSFALPDGAIIAQPGYLAEVSNELQKSLDELVRRYSGRGVPLEGKLVEGIPASEITRLAEEDEASMIVMGTHGRTGLKHFLLGSVAERVVRTAKVPVLTVPTAD
jgi:nucleotide-binding universal stress UspA family protein